MNDKIREVVEKIPISFLLIAYLLYLGYDGYTFTSDSQSPLLQRQQQIEASKGENEKLKKKIVQANLFFKSLDQKRTDLRSLAQQLDELKATLSDNLDIPSFLKTVNTEASKVGLTVVSLRPGEPHKLEYYVEQPFVMTYKGVFVQVLVFLERMAQVERITRVDNIDIQRMGSSTVPYVELGGTIQIKTYRYLGTKADELGRAKAGAAAAAGGGT